ncbi:MAG: hypothetical protein ACI9NC_001829 [Verrucomicrobiales bacterium]|jgi:hypothetical protein
MRQGKSGIEPKMLYLELQTHGAEPKKQIEKLGIRPSGHLRKPAVEMGRRENSRWRGDKR